MVYGDAEGKMSGPPSRGLQFGLQVQPLRLPSKSGGTFDVDGVWTGGLSVVVSFVKCSSRPSFESPTR